jgi:3-dehydroquinate dehydratase-1
MNRLSTVLDRPKPTMAVTFGRDFDPEALDDISLIADVAELRADLMPIPNPVFVKDRATKLAGLPVLLTVRTQAERGGWRGTEAQRLRFVKNLLPLVQGVDESLLSPSAPEVVAEAHRLGKVAIVSTHDFIRTPSANELEDRLERAKDMGADYAKFAASANTIEEFERLRDFTSRHQEDNVIVVAMNDFGPQSRIEFPGIGSHLTYAHAGTEAVAPGQLSYADTHQALKNAYPDYAALFD